MGLPVLIDRSFFLLKGMGAWLGSVRARHLSPER
jgi:hypothetical protein